MWRILVLLAVPVAEIALFIEVGSRIGVWPTIGLVVLAAVIGAAVIRSQGFRSFEKLRAAMATGEDPGPALLDGALVLFAGVLLLIPGFLTDVAGLVLLIPAARAAMMRRAAAGIREGMRSGRVVVTRRGGFGEARPRPDTIDADYEVLDDLPPTQRGASGWTRPNG
jgi:UPF0716 protein FxsA